MALLTTTATQAASTAAISGPSLFSAVVQGPGVPIACAAARASNWSGRTCWTRIRIAQASGIDRATKGRP